MIIILKIICLILYCEFVKYKNDLTRFEVEEGEGQVITRVNVKMVILYYYIID